MIDERDLFEKSFRRYEPGDGSFARLQRRRDRKRRNQRITAGVVGIAVFVAAVWIVTSGLSFDRTQTPAAPGSETGPAETAPPPAPASAAPDVVNRGVCRFGNGFGQPGEARSWLELTDLGDRIRVRFEVHRSAPGDRWTIWIFRHKALGRENLVFQGTRVASDDGDFVVQRSYLDNNRDGFRVRARDRQTDQACEASDWIG